MVARAKRNDPCPCGSGMKYKRCHMKAAQDVESSARGQEVGLDDKNRALLSEVADILGITRGKTWDEVRAELSADQVRGIYEVVGQLWPPGTDPVEALPEPSSSLRAVYMGDITPRAMTENVTRLGFYADELLIFNPFRSPHTFSPEYDPTRH